MLQIMDEFVKAVMARWPKTVLQFEDFNLAHAHPLLARYREHHTVFNDDIQVQPCPMPTQQSIHMSISIPTACKLATS